MTMTCSEEEIWWIDTTTLFVQFSEHGRRSNGILRVMVEMIREARASAGSVSVRLVRFDTRQGGFLEVEWAEYDALLDRNARPLDAVERAKKAALARTTPLRSFLRRLRKSKPQAAPGLKRSFRVHPFHDGDTWICLGFWWHDGMMAAIAAIRDAPVRLRTAVLVHDCIPLLRPEMCTRDTVAAWNGQIEALRGYSDILLANSRNTAADVARLIRRDDLRIPVVPLGDHFTLTDRLGDIRSMPRISHLAVKPYVLVVGTIEPRKNHMLALRTWQRLRNALDLSLPDLVFAGSWGWDIDTLRREIAAARCLDGHLHIVEAPTDAQLAALYRGAIFTLYPSHYEGWGLPVRESLYHGRICLVAHNSALPEAGGELACYFADDDADALAEAVAGLVRDEPRRKALEERIADNFRPVGWRLGWERLEEILG